MADTSTAEVMHAYVVPWAGGGVAGMRRIRAPNGEAAERDLREHPSEYGLSCETPIVGRALRCVVIEPSEYERATLRHR